MTGKLVGGGRGNVETRHALSLDEDLDRCVSPAVWKIRHALSLQPSAKIQRNTGNEMVENLNYLRSSASSVSNRKFEI